MCRNMTVTPGFSHTGQFSLELPVLSCLSRMTLDDPRDWSPPGSSVHGIFQAGILEWLAMTSSRGSSWPRDRICVSCIAGGLATEPQWEIQSDESISMFKNVTSDSWFLSYRTCSLWEEGGPNAQRTHTVFFETQINNVQCNQLLNQILFACAPLLLVSRLGKLFSHQDSVVQAQGQKYRSMEQSGEPRDKSTHLWTPHLWQRMQGYTLQKRQSL